MIKIFYTNYINISGDNISQIFIDDKEYTLNDFKAYIKNLLSDNRIYFDEIDLCFLYLTTNKYKLDIRLNTECNSFEAYKSRVSDEERKLYFFLENINKHIEFICKYKEG